MHVQHRITVAARPEVIFGIYEDVAHWHTWDPDTKAASLDGPFQVGGRGRLVPTRGHAVPMLLTEVIRNRSFTVESGIPLFRMRFEHELTPVADGTQVVHRVHFFGALAFVIGAMLRRRLNHGLPITLGRLKALAEGSGSANPAP